MKPTSTCEECKKEFTNDQMQNKKFEGKSVCTDCFLKLKDSPAHANLVKNVKEEKETTAPIKRYKDAYLLSRTIIGVGETMKTIASGQAVIIIIGAYYLKLSMPISVSILAATVVVGVLIYFLGILVSALGQIHKAVLDTAVTSSPFLTKEEMKKAMSLQ